jgi:hypothetical protein
MISSVLRLSIGLDIYNLLNKLIYKHKYRFRQNLIF